MSIGALTLRDLEYVVAVAEHRHFGRAAEACAVSQPTLSAQVKKVEDLLAIQLFERTRRRVFVTPIGEEVAALARAVLQDVRRLLDASGSRREPLGGHFGLGVIATLGPYLMPHLLGPLKHRFPRLELHLREGMTHVLLDTLKAGGLDAVLAALPVDDASLAVEPLFHEPFVLALPAGHPLARKEKVSPGDLRADAMVLLEDGHCLRDQVLGICPDDRHVRTARLQATSLETLRHMVAAGAGYSLIPNLAGKDDLGKLVCYRSFRRPVPGRTIGLVWRRGFARSGDLASLAKLIRESLPRMVVPIAGRDKVRRDRVGGRE